MWNWRKNILPVVSVWFCTVGVKVKLDSDLVLAVVKTLCGEDFGRIFDVCIIVGVFPSVFVDVDKSVVNFGEIFWDTDEGSLSSGEITDVNVWIVDDCIFVFVGGELSFEDSVISEVSGGIKDVEDSGLISNDDWTNSWSVLVRIIGDEYEFLCVGAYEILSRVLVDCRAMEFVFVM